MITKENAAKCAAMAAFNDKYCKTNNLAAANEAANSAYRDKLYDYKANISQIIDDLKEWDRFISITIVNDDTFAQDLRDAIQSKNITVNFAKRLLIERDSVRRQQT